MGQLRNTRVSAREIRAVQSREEAHWADYIESAMRHFGFHLAAQDFRTRWERHNRYYRLMIYREWRDRCVLGSTVARFEASNGYA